MSLKKSIIFGVGSDRPVEIRELRNGKRDVQFLIPEFINYPLIKEKEL